jgi:hypothetical protein
MPVAVPLLGVFTSQLAVILPLFPEFLVVFVNAQAALQLLGPALFLRGRVALFLLLAQRFQLAFQGLIARPGRLVGIGHGGLRDVRLGGINPTLAG